MNLEVELLTIINSELEKVDIELLWTQVSISMLVDKWMLLLAVECLYFKELVIKKQINNKLLTYMSMLKDSECPISMLSYLYIIYDCDKIMNKKCDSPNNLYM